MSRILESASEISTHFRCHNCGILLTSVNWWRCGVCKAFDLCDACKARVDHLARMTVFDHNKYHEDHEFPPVSGDYLEEVSIIQAEDANDARLARRKKIYGGICNSKKKIENDYDMAVVMKELAAGSSTNDSNVQSLVVDYFLRANERNIRVLSLDGGGVRGYMPIKILEELIAKTNNFKVEDLDLKNLDDKAFFLSKQKEVTKHFDYFVGTSTGGLIAFCLAVNYNILDMEKIYSDSKKYFKKNRFLGPFFYSKYDPSVIHNQIDEIIDQLEFPGKTFPSKASEHATLLDLRNLMNPEKIIRDDEIEAAMITHGNSLEFVDKKPPQTRRLLDESDLQRVEREKVLLITSYNTTGNTIIIFNTSYAPHWQYRISDVLKSTMAAPTYFPPQKVYRGIQTNGRFIPQGDPELYVDGGIFANDPEVAALWALRMQWKKPANYNLLCVGTGCYTSKLSLSTWGGYLGWIFNNGFLVNTLMDATRSFTEIIGCNLSKFNNMKRMKLNYKITESMALDDPRFVDVFNREWEQRLKDEDDFKAFVYFYETYIAKK